jgi:hypothetical protein
MERVTFLLEASGDRLTCMLNPETLVVRRRAGVLPRRSIGGRVSGGGRADEPLLFTGGGVTELELDLLFDVTLLGSSVSTDNVRDLTTPFVEMTENLLDDKELGHPPLVRFVWGKSWNIPGIVTSVAERFEFFTAGGEPRRSWMRMRMVRAGDDALHPLTQPSPLLDLDPEEIRAASKGPTEDVRVHEVLGSAAPASDAGSAEGAGGASEVADTERLDAIAQRYYGNPALWRVLAAFNGITDPLHLTPGQLIRIPPLTLLAKAP